MVAFALTLLVLQVTVPPLSQVADPTSAADLAAQLAKQAGSPGQLRHRVLHHRPVLADHRRVFRHIVGHRDSLVWWNFAFLATITVMPFTSSLLGEYPRNPLAVDIFAANLLLAVLAVLAVLATRAMFVLGRRWGLDYRGHRHRDAWALRARAAATILVVAVSIGLAWVNTTAAKYCWVLIPAVQWAVEYKVRTSGRPAARPAHLDSSQQSTVQPHGPAQAPCASSLLTRTAHLAHRGGVGSLQAVRRLHHQDPLEAQADGQVQNDGGGPLLAEET